jgi:hypothetical protein
VPCCCTTGTAALVVSISLGMTSSVLVLAAFQFQFDRFFEPTLIVASGAHQPSCCVGRRFSTCLGTTSPQRCAPTCCGGSCARAIGSSLTFDYGRAQLCLGRWGSAAVLAMGARRC